MGTADYIYRFYDSTGPDQHAAIELTFDVSVLNGAAITSVEWRPSCGNDEVMIVSVPSSATPVVPEPTSFLIWGGLSLVTSFGALFRRRI